MVCLFLLFSIASRFYADSPDSVFLYLYIYPYTHNIYNDIYQMDDNYITRAESCMSITRVSEAFIAIVKVYVLSSTDIESRCFLFMLSGALSQVRRMMKSKGQGFDSL